MENEKKTARRFQFHLSTAVVLMLAAGLLLGINFYPRRTMMFIDNWDDRGFYAVEKGWPFTVQGGFGNWNGWALAVNGFVSLLFLWLVLTSMEILLRKDRPTIVSAIRKWRAKWLPAVSGITILGLMLALNLSPRVFTINENAEAIWKTQGWPVPYRYFGENFPAKKFMDEWYFGWMVSDLVFWIVVTTTAMRWSGRLNIFGKSIHKRTLATMAFIIVVLVPFEALYERTTDANISKAAPDSDSNSYRFRKRVFGFPFVSHATILKSKYMNIGEGNFPIGSEILDFDSDGTERYNDRNAAIKTLEALDAQPIRFAYIYNVLCVVCVALLVGLLMEWIFPCRESN